MRRWLIGILAAVTALAWLLSAGCAKKALKDTPEEGEEQPSDTGPAPAPTPIGR